MRNILKMQREFEHPEIDNKEEASVDEKTTYRLLLYNDDWHSFDEVIFQLIKAIHCTYDRARGIAFEVHVKGFSVVYTGELNECLRISSILEEIELHTQILL